MTMYFYYQETPRSVWLPALASERANIIRTKKPALCTVLDVDSTFEDGMTQEQRASVKHAGPLYFDVDCPDIDTAIEQTKKLLTLIKSKGVDLEMLRCYMSGKKGFHILVDHAIFMPRVPAGGIHNLPTIYKEMVWACLFTDGVDMRVFSQGRGRMLRSPNVQRDDNGAYKVSVTADEIFNLTPETYAQLCASPRNEVPVEPPKFCPELGLAFSVAQDKVVKAAARRKTKKNQCDDLKKFGGAWPETLQLVINGLGLREDVGFNQVALQVCITACTLGIDEEKLLADCSGLIETHKGDSSRYGTPGRRRAFLKEMFRYVDSNPLYDFSAGGVLSLLIPEVRANSDLSFGEWQPDDTTPKPKPKKPTKPKPAPAEGAAETTTTEAETTTDEDEDEGEPEDDEPDDGGRIQMSRGGTFFKTEDGYKNVCDLGFFRPISMRKLNGEHIGYEVDTYLDGKDAGKKFIPMNAFTSKGQFNNWSLNQGASMRASDIQTSSLSDHFRRRSSKNPVYAVEREGIDVIVPPGAKTGDQIDVIWASPEGVVCENKEINYRYHGIYNAQGTYKSDLMMADELSLADEEFVSKLLDINTTGNVAKLLGWFSAAFVSQLIRKKFKRFPSMQVFGQAGAGKSMTVILMNHMHYNLVEPRQFSVAGQTMFPIIVAVATSASLPLVFEEVKARQLTKTAKDFLQNILRSNYTADQLQRGSLGRDKTVREPTVTDFANAAPIVFVGEAIEDQSAILERCVVVALSKSDQRGKEANFEFCMDRATQMGRIGKRLARAALSVNRDELHEELSRNFKQVSGLAQAAMIDGASRPSFNLAVVITGLEFLRLAISGVFGDKFDGRIEKLKQSVLDNVADNIPKNMAEASRVLDTLAFLSRHQDVAYQVVHGVDYTINEPAGTLDLKLRNAYAKYVKYQRSLGMEVLFDHENAFVTALANYGGTVRKACPDNMHLYDSPRAVIYRLDLAYLEREGVDGFKEK